MTRGRCGSLGLHRTALSSAPPRRFIPALPPRFLQTHLTVTPLRFAITSRPSRCEEDLHLLADEHARHTRKWPGGLRRRAVWKSFSLASDFYEDDNQREERERLDEHQAEDHCRADCCRCSGIAGDPFASRRSDTALP